MKRLAELPPGMPRVAQLNGDLDTGELHDLAVNYVHFAQFVTTMLEEAAREGAVLVEVRFGVGAGLGPRHMSLFREAERRVRKRYPYFYAEAIAVIFVPSDGGPEAFETILRARDQGLAGIDFVPAPLRFRGRLDRDLRVGGAGGRGRPWHHCPCRGVLNR